MRILLVEDNVRLAEFICQGLTDGGFVVDVLSTLTDAEAALASTDFHVVILDLRLPDGDGMDLLKQIRQRRLMTPVLVVTARDGIEDRVYGLNAGADDYVLKPFAMEELLARVRALLRRPGGVLGVGLECGGLVLDTLTREVRISGTMISVPKRETHLLEQLLRRAGRVVPKRLLEDGIYGFGDDVSSNSIEALISRLRKRLAQNGADVTIHTLRGVGYVLAETRADPVK